MEYLYLCNLNDIIESHNPGMAEFDAAWQAFVIALNKRRATTKAPGIEWHHVVFSVTFQPGVMGSSASTQTIDRTVLVDYTYYAKRGSDDKDFTNDYFIVPMKDVNSPCAGMTKLLELEEEGAIESITYVLGDIYYACFFMDYFSIDNVNRDIPQIREPKL